MIGAVRDITKRYEVEKALSAVEKELRTIFDLVPVLIWYKDKQNNILRVNQKAADWFGLPIEAIVGRDESEFFIDENVQAFDDDAIILSTGKPKNNIIESRQKADGEVRWLKTDKLPYIDESGKIQGIIVCSSEITELTDVKANLERIESNYLQLLQWDKLTRETNTVLVDLTSHDDLSRELSQRMGKALNADLCYTILFSDNLPEKTLFEYTSGLHNYSIVNSMPSDSLISFFDQNIDRDSQATLFKIENIKELKLDCKLTKKLSTLLEDKRIFSGYIFAPMLHNDTLLGIVVIKSINSRYWNEAELYFIKSTLCMAKLVLANLDIKRKALRHNYIRSHLFFEN